VVPDEGEARILCKIPVKKASYLHSFALTENYFILQVLHTPNSQALMLWKQKAEGVS